MTAKRVKVPLGDVCDVRQGRYLAPGDMSDVKADLTPIPVIGANGVLGYTDQVSYHDPVTLVTCRGSNCGMLQRTHGPTWISNNAMACPPKKPHNSRYIHYVLQATNFSEVVTGSAQPQITAGHLNAKVLAITRDPDEQKAIAEVLGRLDDKITLNNRINAELEGIAKLLYDYWFVQFDFPMTAAQATALGKPHLTGHPYRASGGKMIYNETLKREIPEGWEVRKLNEVGTFKNGINYSPQDLGDTMAHIINVRNMSSSSFFLETSSLDEILLIGKSVKNYLVSEKSVLIARSGIPGATRLIQNHKDNTIYCGFIICFEPYRLKDRNLVFFYMKMIESAMTSNAAGTVLKNVSQDTLKALCIPFPGNNVGDDTLEKFNAIIGPIFNELGILNQQNQELTQLRDWLLPMLMNGQVTVG